MRRVILAALACVIVSGQLARADAPATRPATRPAAAGELLLQETPLREVLATVEKMAGANVFVDYKAIEAAGVSLDTPVTLRLTRPTVGRLLRVLMPMAGEGKLTYYTQDNLLHVTSIEAADRVPITVSYDINDLLIVPTPIGQTNATPPTRAAREKEILAQVRSVDEARWDDKTFRAVIIHGKLVVTAPRSTHERIGGALR